MKRFAMLTVLALTFVVPAAFAQDHGEVGVFVDYLRLHHANDANFLGLGGRAGFNVHRSVQLEAEMSYDFERNITTTQTNGATTNFFRSDLRMIHGLFGPKFQTGGGAVRAFAVLKGGLLNFSLAGTRALSGSTFTGQINSIPDGDTNGVFYPGGGIELFAGPIGVRFEIGDLMYFDNGANHNLRVTVGPQIRF
jgi:hypothetical protein